MVWGDRKLQGPEERRALKLSMPPGLSRWVLNFTVLEHEFRVATVGRVAACAPMGKQLSPNRPPVAPACDIDRRERSTAGQNHIADV
jgi:hypothetical protein